MCFCWCIIHWSRPDITVMDDWALKINYLSIHWSFIWIFIQSVSSTSALCSLIESALEKRHIMPQVSNWLSSPHLHTHLQDLVTMVTTQHSTMPAVELEQGWRVICLVLSANDDNGEELLCSCYIVWVVFCVCSWIHGRRPTSNDLLAVRSFKSRSTVVWELYCEVKIQSKQYVLRVDLMVMQTSHSALKVCVELEATCSMSVSMFLCIVQHLLCILEKKPIVMLSRRGMRKGVGRGGEEREGGKCGKTW